MLLQILVQNKAYAYFNSARIFLNCSLNGDLNLRVFAVLAADGFLLTDRLSSFSGINDLFREDVDFAAYGDQQELEQKSSYFLDHETERTAIAQQGHKSLIQQFCLDSRIDYLQRLVTGQELDSVFSIHEDKRIGAYRSDSNSHLLFRIRFYEWAQEIHKRVSRFAVICSKKGDVRICRDLADLPRIDIFRSVGAEDGMNSEMIQKCGLEKEIRVITELVNPETS